MVIHIPAFGRMAAMAAIMAALGLAVGAVSGGMGGGSKEFEYKNIGTSWHENASDVSGILDSMDWTMTRTMQYSKGMYDSLKQLVFATGQAARNLNLAGFNFTAVPESSSTSGLLGFGSKSSLTKEQGIRFDAKSYQDFLASGITGATFQSGQKTKSSWWGLKSKTTQWYKEQALGKNITDPITKAYHSALDAVVAGIEATKLGDVQGMLNRF